MAKEKVDIVIVGAGLTGLTLAYYLKKAGKKVILLEKDEKVGGVIQSVSEEGFVYEKGPNTGVLSTEGIVDLFDELNDVCKPETPTEKANERWILKSGKWQALPNGLIKAICTPLFSLKDKFRILGEPWRKKGTNPDESLADMVKRRLGDSYLDYAVDPFISGIYAGDPEVLITRFAMPKLYNLEQDYGSFIKGAIKKKKEPKTELQKRITREVFSTEGGLSNLIAALLSKIGESSIVCNCQNIKVQPTEINEYLIDYELNGEQKELITEKVVTTFGGYELKNLLSFISEKLLLPILNLRYAKVVQVVLGYKKWQGKKLEAFGGLVPTVENRDILGILFPSALFKGRSPEGGAVLSVFIGGTKKSEMIHKSDDDIKNIVLKEVKETLYSDEAPDLIRIFKYEKAIPQYDITSKERLASIDKIEEEFSGLYIAGNIRDGIGMADRVQQARNLSKLILKTD